MILIKMCRILVKVQNYLDEIRQNTNSWDGIQVLRLRVCRGRMAPLLSQGPCILQQCPLCPNSLGVLQAPWRAEWRHGTWENGVGLWL